MTYTRWITRLAPIVVFVALALVPAPARAQLVADAPTPRQELSAALKAWMDIVEPPAGAAPRTFVAKLSIDKADGLPKQAVGASAEVAFQPPDRLRIISTVDGAEYSAGRVGNQLWADEPAKHFAVVGTAGVLKFSRDPASIDQTVLPPFSLPISQSQLALLVFGLNVEMLPPERIDQTHCEVLHVAPNALASEFMHGRKGEATLWIRPSDHMPLRVLVDDLSGHRVQVSIAGAKLENAWDEKAWAPRAADGDAVHTVAVSHLWKFLQLAPAMANDRCPPLPPAEGKRTIVAREGQGRLELIDGARVLFLKGSPREMGHQHGVLLKREIHAVADRILYGVGVGSSFVKGNWFFGEVEGAEARLEPFMDKRYLAEEDSIADAAGMSASEARLANFFPELFHCSGFALFGKATANGHLYHGRVLDYLKGVGLEQNAVTIMHQPDYGHAWINISYAGFVGSVTAMNDQGISIGEMGGGGYGSWDGVPMAHLVRQVMEQASTLDEAVDIMRKAPRTCQYYYVIADGKAHDAVGVAANAREFTTLKPGEYHPLLPNPQPDAVLLSAGKRYETLAKRVKDNYGRFDADSARKLMDPPVCMSSNIQSVLFQPDTLDLWVANADSQHVASEARYTHYNLKDLLAEDRLAAAK